MGPMRWPGSPRAKCTNEDNYVFQKFVRAVIGTQNVDHCARLCHASTVTGLLQSLGSGAMTNSFNDLEDADAILIIGSNTSEAHPIGALHIKKAMRKGAKLIVVDPRRIDMARRADIHLQLLPGTNVAVVNGLMHVIIEEGLTDTEFIAERTEDFDQLPEVLATYTPEFVEQISGVPADKIREAARIFATAAKGAIFYSMGVTQHSHGTEHVISLSNLALMTGNLGRAGVGVNPLRGQNNVQGACDMGALPNVYTGYQPVGDAAAQERFDTAWGVTLPDKPGLTVTEVVDGMQAGTLRGLYVVGENPLLSDPDLNHVEEAFHDLDFLVVQDHLPERDGTARRCGAAGGELRREGRHLHQHRAQGAARARRRPESRRGAARLGDHRRPRAAAWAPRDGWDYRTPGHPGRDQRAHPSYAGITFATGSTRTAAFAGRARTPSTPARRSSTSARSRAARASSSPISYQSPPTRSGRRLTRSR